ncbi:MAG TPA: hypothetical protein VFK94_04490 [Patescibacteria group bacterium]|nr:hypothetical protein [Patescibacteria group bacterium]
MHPALRSDPWSDFVALLSRIISDPAVFLGPTTGQTAGLDLTTVGLVAGQIILLPKETWRIEYQRVLLRYLGLLFPAVLLINVGMVMGSIGVSGYLFAKFQAELPQESWKQLWSGAGHAAITLLVMAVCWHQIKRGRYSPRDWVMSWSIANLYWLYQLILNTPPWLGFQQQLPILLGSSLVGVGVSSIGNLVYFRRVIPGSRLPTNQTNALL